MLVIYECKAEVVDLHFLDSEDLVWIDFFLFVLLYSEDSAQVLECGGLSVFEDIFQDEVHLGIADINSAQSD